MNTLITLAYVLLIVVIAALALIIIGIIKTRKCKILDVIGIVLSMGLITLIATIIYFNPKRSIVDFVKPIITVNGVDWSFKTNPQVCHEEQDGRKRLIVMCPAWIEDNVQVCLSYQEQTDSRGYKFCEYAIRLAFPQTTRTINKPTSSKWYDKMYVRLDNGKRMESSVMTSFNENIGYYSFKTTDFKRMAEKGIISISYRSPNGLGLWKRMGDEGMIAINEQMIVLLNYMDGVKNDASLSHSEKEDQNNKNHEQSVNFENQIVVIDGSELRLRLGPSTSYETLKWGDGSNRHPEVGGKFRLLDESGDFYKIDFKGNEVWVSKQFTHIENQNEKEFISNDLYDKNQISERAKVLIDYFHYYNLRGGIESAFSKEYCRLYRHAHDIPSDNPQGIGSEEIIQYAMSVGSFNGDDMCESHPKTIQSVKLIDDKTAEVKMNYFHEDHEMILVLENGKWMVDDLNGSKKKAREYIKEQRAYFKSQKWEDYLQIWLIEGDNRYSDEELKAIIAKCRKEVEDYFKKHPE